MSRSSRLDELRAGQRGRIKSVSPCGSLGQRLMAMGLVEGEELEMIRLAPSGDPIEVLLRGCRLALRRSEARMVNLEAEGE